MTSMKLIEQTLLANYDKYYRLAKSYTHNSDDALDIVQNGAYRAIKAGKKIKNEAFVETWMYRIMLNEIFRFCKTNKNILVVPQDMAPDMKIHTKILIFRSLSTALTRKINPWLF